MNPTHESALRSKTRLISGTHGFFASTRSFARIARFGRLASTALLCSIVGLAAGTPAFAGPSASDDTDLDGLSDALESYLALVSSSPAWEVSPYNGDTDADSQPDGFEFCLSGRYAPVSPGVTYPVVPKMTLGSYQSGSDIVVSLFVIPGALSMIDDFGLYLAVDGPTEPVQLANITAQLAYAIDDVSFVWWGPYQMAVLNLRIPVDFVRKYGSVALAAIGKLDGVEIGDSMTLAWHTGRVFRWTYFQAKAEGGEGSSVAAGFAEPQDGAVSSDWTQDQVCGSVDSQAPTGTPGVLESVVASIGCTTGTFACNGGICSLGGAAAAPKLVLDVDLLHHLP